MSVTRTALIALALSCLVLGASLGAATDIICRRPGRDRHGPPDGGPGGPFGGPPNPDAAVRFLDRTLDLDPPQEEQVRQAVSRAKERSRAAAEATHAQFQGIRKDLEQDIRAQLNPTQTARYDEFLRKRTEKREGFFKRRGERREGRDD